MSQSPQLKRLLQVLTLGGYWYSREALMAGKVDLTKLHLLNGDELVVQLAVKALQSVDQNYAFAVAATYGDQRVAEPDGEAGPATEMLIEMPRCGCPTFYDPDSAEAAMALDRGSWDTGCVAGYEDKHAIIVRWTGLELLPQRIRDNFNMIWKLAVDAQAKVGLVVVRDDNHSDPHIAASVSSNMPGGAIGYAQVPNDPDCPTRVWARVNPGYNPSNYMDTWPALIVHELFGHNSGQNHTSGGIMNPSIQNKPWAGWEANDPGTPRQLAWFGGPVTPVPPIPEPPTPVPPGSPPAIGQPLGSPFTTWDGMKAQTFRVFSG